MAYQLVTLTGGIQQIVNVSGGLVPRGAFDVLVTYAIGDMVDYNGSSYVLFTTAVAGTLPTDGTKWGLVAEKGDAGTGIATGGTAHQALTKVNGTDFNTQWETIDKTFVGLGNADNTSDVNKPISSATQTALDNKLDDTQLDTDDTLTANSDTKIASQKATKTYADTKVAKAGDTMSGNLNMGTNKLIGGTGVTDVLKLQGTTGNGTSSSPAIQLLTGNNGATTALTVLNNGNVGVGTTAPATNLHISSAAGLTGSSPTEMRIATTTNSSAWDTAIDWGRLSFYSADASNGGAKNHVELATRANTTTGGVSDFYVRTSDSSGVMTDRMKIDYQGYANLYSRVLIGDSATALGAQLVVAPTASTTPGIIAKGAASQTADLLQIQNSAGSVLSEFDSAGRLAVNTTSTTSALTVKGTDTVATVGVSNLLTADGTFATSTGWTTTTGWTIGSGVADHATGNTGTLSGTSTATSTTTVYQVNFTVTQTTAGSGFGVSLGGNDSDTTINTAGAKTLYIRPTSATGALVFTPLGAGTWVGSIDNVTIYAITAGTADIAVQGSNGASTPLEIRQGGSGSASIGVGAEAMRYNTSGFSSTGVGYRALRHNITGNYNTAIGAIALTENTSGSNNTAVGYASLQANGAGGNNSALGFYSLYSNTSGLNNAALGYMSIYSNTSGIQNSALGHFSLYSNTTGNYNVALGSTALYSNTTANENAAVGFGALYSNTTGNGNTAIGTYAGRYHTSASALTAPANSTFLGYNTRASADGNTNEIVIGSSAIGNGSNSVTLGNTSITKTILQGDVGIGTTTPSSTFDLHGSFELGIVNKTANYTAANETVINCTANTFTVTLPTAVGIDGRYYTIKNSGAGVITVATTSSQTIDGAATQSLPTQYDKITVVSDGTNWIVI